LQNYEVSTAHERLGSLLDRILSAVPGTVILVSTLIPNTDAPTEANIEIINSNIQAMVQSRVAAGSLIQLVDMHNGKTLFSSSANTPTPTSFLWS
jgi:hypothetical protein